MKTPHKVITAPTMKKIVKGSPKKNIENRTASTGDMLDAVVNLLTGIVFNA